MGSREEEPPSSLPSCGFIDRKRTLSKPLIGRHPRDCVTGSFASQANLRVGVMVLHSLSPGSKAIMLFASQRCVRCILRLASSLSFNLFVKNVTMMEPLCPVTRSSFKDRFPCDGSIACFSVGFSLSFILFSVIHWTYHQWLNLFQLRIIHSIAYLSVRSTASVRLIVKLQLFLMEDSVARPLLYY